jgi:hypothetical protein
MGNELHSVTFTALDLENSSHYQFMEYKMPTLQQIVQNYIGDKGNLPLGKFRISDDYYVYLKNRLSTPIKYNSIEDFIQGNTENYAAFIIYIVESFHRELKADQTLIKITNFLAKQSQIQEGFKYLKIPILYDTNNQIDFYTSIFAEIEGRVTPPLILIRDIVINNSNKIELPLSEYISIIDKFTYTKIKNSLKYYFFQFENNENVVAWSALFCIYAVKKIYCEELDFSSFWDELEDDLSLNLNQQEKILSLGLNDFWHRSILNHSGNKYLYSLFAESGVEFIKSPRNLLNEILFDNNPINIFNVKNGNVNLDEIQNALLFYKHYFSNNYDTYQLDKFDWEALFYIFATRQNQQGLTQVEIEKLITHDFTFEQIELFNKTNRNQLWGKLSMPVTTPTTQIAVLPQTTILPFIPNNPLRIKEDDLKQKIDQKIYPFLGLYAEEIDSLTEQEIKNEINKNLSIQGFIRCLNFYPAIFTVYLAHKISEGTGQTQGALEIYPVIAEAIGLTNLNVDVTDREPLWMAFRKACQSLQMKVSPRTSGPLFMSDEYLLQAGIPNVFLSDVAVKVFRLVKQIGLPSDDPALFQQWKDTFNNSLTLPFPQTARRSLLLDKDGFYIKNFIELYQNQQPNDSSLAVNIKNAIQNATVPNLNLVQTKQKLEIPQFIFRDGKIGVLLPSSETNQTWVITTTDQYNSESNFQYQVDLDEKFIPFDWSPIILKVEVKNVVSELSLDFNVWEDNTTDRFLLFSESGEIHTSSKNDIGTLQLEVGSYVLFSRFQPVLAFNQIAQLPDVFKSEINFATGQQIQISNNFIVETQSVATMSWTGNSVRSNEGTEIYPSENLILTVNVPQDNQIYRVVLSSDAGNTILLNVSSPKDIFNLSNKFIQNAWKPCVTRLIVKLILVGGNNKTVASGSLWVWIGLQNVNGRITFDCSALPNNFNKKESQGFFIENNRLTYNPSYTQPHFSFVFNRPNGQALTSTWRKPQIFLQREDMVNGIETITPIDLASTVSATHNSQRKLRIFYNLDGTLSMGGFNQQVNFSRYGEYTLSLASLLGNVKPGNNILRYASPKGVSVDLITLVEPSVTNFDVIANVGQTKTIHINYTNSIDNLRLVFTELSANKTHEVMVGKTPGVLKLPFGATVHFTAEMIDANNWQHILTIDYQNLVDGVWFVDFETEQFGGEWKKLTNSVGHVVGFGLLMQNGVLLNDQPHQFIPATNLLLLNSITQKLSVRYENEAWQYLKWLNTLWNRLIRTTHLVANNIAPLLNLLGIPLQQSDEIPQQHILAALPQLLAQSADCYANLDTQNNLLLLYLRTFSNVKNIDIQKLKNSDRYFEAQQKLEERYNNTLPNAGDSLGFALNLSQKLNNPALLNVIFNPNLNNLPNAGNFVLAPLGNPVLDDLEKLLSILAFASRLDASNGNNNYGEQIKVVANNIAENRDIFLKILSYIFTIGEDLLGFYLLYWEANL